MPLTTSMLALALGTTNDATKLEIKTDVDTRLRFERRTDRDFLSTNRDNRSDLFTRFRPGVTLTYGQWVSQFRLQYSHSLRWTSTGNGSTENRDLDLGYIQYKGESGTFTIGRFKLNFGNERLIGGSEWTNMSRSFDGIRYQSGKLDVFAAKIGVQANRPKDARIAGVRYANKFGDTMYILKTDEVGAGDVTIHTLNHHWKGNFGKAKADIEVSGQVGEVGSRDHSAYAVTANLTLPVNDQLSMGLIGNIASGGQSAGHTKTFDTLYPTAHKFNGSADLQGFRNMKEITFFANYKTDPNGSLKVAYHNFWLFDDTDAWYGVTGAPNARFGGTFVDGTGASGDDVGSELDIEYTRSFGKNGTFALGFAVFEPGDFIKSLVGGASKRSTWGYAQYSIKF